MIFDSGSVKLRCAFGLGANGSRPSARRARLLALLGHLLAPGFLGRPGLRPPAPPWPRGSAPGAPRGAEARPGSSSPRRSGPKLVLLGVVALCVCQQRVDLLAQRGDLDLELGLRARSSARSSSPCAATRWRAAWCRRRPAPRARPARPAGTAAAPARTDPPTRPGAARGSARSTGSPDADRRTASAPPHPGRSHAQASGRRHPDRVAVDEQLDHQPRVIRRKATLLVVVVVDRRQVQRAAVDQIRRRSAPDRHPAPSRAAPAPSTTPDQGHTPETSSPRRPARAPRPTARPPPPRPTAPEPMS